MTISEQLSNINSVPILPISHPSFRKFGKPVHGYDFTSLIDYMTHHTEIPLQGNLYKAGDPDMELMPICQQLQQGFYGSFPLQIGYCNGQNTRLNALEYHKSSELDVAVTDMVLLVAELSKVEHNLLDSSQVEAFYLPAATAVEIYSTTLHFSPCKTSKEGFKSVIILPRGTNYPLEEAHHARTEEDELLWMTNKWLIAHKDSIPASKGAFVGLTGTNIEVQYI